MHEIGVAVDAGNLALGEQGVGLPTGIALRLDRARIMTAAARDAIPAPDLCMSLLFKFGAPRFPDFWIAEIVGRFDVNVANAGGDVNVGF